MALRSSLILVTKTEKVRDNVSVTQDSAFVSTNRQLTVRLDVFLIQTSFL